MHRGLNADWDWFQINPTFDGKTLLRQDFNLGSICDEVLATIGKLGSYYLSGILGRLMGKDWVEMDVDTGNGKNPSEEPSKPKFTKITSRQSSSTQRCF